MRLNEMKRRIMGVLREFKGEKMGVIGLTIIVSLAVIALAAPVLAPNTNAKWRDVDRWKDLPNGAAPVWTKYISSESKAPQLVQESPDVFGGGGYKTITYEYQYDYDLPPKEIVLYIEGEYRTETPNLIVEMVRPDGKSLQLLSESVRGEKDTCKKPGRANQQSWTPKEKG